MEQFSKRVCQFLALIETALTQTGCVQRYRNDDIRPGQISADLCEECSQKVQCCIV